MDDIYQYIEKHNQNKKHRILIAFDDMIADMLSNNKLNPIGTELFIRGGKLNIFLVFITIVTLNLLFLCQKILA